MYSIWRKFKTSQSRRKATRSQGLNRQRLFNIEPLQTRDLLTVTFTPLPQTWVSEGPAPILDGQTAGLTSPANPVTGAVKAIAVTPNNPDIIFVATVNGGIWKTTNGTSGTPTWTPETDSANSLSMSSISFDLSDGTYNTLIAGVGHYSSDALIGGTLTGLMRTTNGGATWTQLTATGLAGLNVSSVVEKGSTIIAGVQGFVGGSLVSAGGGLYISTNTGASFTAVTLPGSPGVGDVFDIEQDPGVSNRVYVAYGGIFGNNRIFRSDDFGTTWVNVSSGITFTTGTNTVENMKIAVQANFGSNANAVYVGIATTNAVSGGVGLTGMYRSTTFGASWTAMSTPTTIEGGGTFGLEPDAAGGQGDIHLSIAADPNNSNLVYVGGDRQPGNQGTAGSDYFTGPNSVGATNYTGRLFRGDASKPLASQWTPLTNNFANGTGPHADSRALVFDSQGNLLEGDDGGIYKRVAPQGNANWVSLIGNLAVTEFYSAIIDPNTNTIFGGAQDVGNEMELTTGGTTWETLTQGDGNTVGLDTTSSPGQSIRYFGYPSLGAFYRQTFNGSNTAVTGQIFLPLTINGTGGGSLYTNDTLSFTTPFAINSVAGKQLVIASATNALYESFDQGNTLTKLGTLSSRINTIAYGGSQGGTANASVMWVGTSGGSHLYLRSSGTGLPTAVANYPGAFSVVGIAVNPNNWQAAYVVDAANTIRGTTDGGNTWTTLTGNLPGLGGLRAIAYISHAGVTDSIVVGGLNGGVYRMSISNPGVWTQLGAGLANAPINQLTYDTTHDQLVAATQGRGAWEVQSASLPTLQKMTVTGDDVTTPVSRNDAIVFRMDAVVAGQLDVTVNAVTEATVQLNTIGATVVDGLLGTNTLTLDFTNGSPINVGTFSYMSTGGTSIIAANANANYTLSPTSLAISTGATAITLSGVTTANLTGGASANNFTINGWTGSGTLTGGGGSDTFTYAGDTNQNLTNTTFTASNGANLTLSGLTNFNLQGGAGNNTFTVTGFTGTASINGLGGSDNVADSAAANYSVTSTGFTVSTGGTFNLTSIGTLNLTRSTAGAAFTVNGWLGTANLFATGVGNAVSTTNYSTYSLNTNTNFSVDTGTINTTNFQTLTFNGKAGGGNSFTVLSPFTTTATLNGTSGANNSINATMNTTFTLATNNLTLGTGANLTLQNLNVAKLTGTTAGQTFNINSWAGSGTFSGGGAAGDAFRFAGGNLNLYTLGAFNVGNSAGASLYLDDSATALVTSYDVTSTQVIADSTTKRAFAGVNFDSTITTVTLDGSTGVNGFYVMPGFVANVVINAKAIFNIAPFIDNLSVALFGTVNPHMTTVWTAATGNGVWAFGDRANTITFSGMGTINTPNILAVAPGGPDYNASSTPLVQVFDPTTGIMRFQFYAYEQSYHGGVRLVHATYNGLPVIITAPGKGRPGDVIVWDANVPVNTPIGATVVLNKLATFQPYGAGWTNGISLSVGNITNTVDASSNSIPDIIVGPGSGAANTVQLWVGAASGGKITGYSQRAAFYPYGTSFIGGIELTVGNMRKADTHQDLITAPSAGAAAIVEIWNGAQLTLGNAVLVNSFTAFVSTFHGGVSLAATDTDTDGISKLFVAAGSAGGTTNGSVVKIFTVQNSGATIALNNSFKAYTDSSSTVAATRILAANVLSDGTMQILTAQGPNGRSNAVKAFRENGQFIGQITVTNPALSGGMYLG